MTAALPVSVAIPSLAMSEGELISVLGSSIYPGAKVESIKLVISYCKARQLDPLQKPVHIVPMSVKVGKKPNGNDEYEYRDVIMPGIGLYRTDATRTSVYAGKTEPEFGPDKQLSVGDFTMAYPEWCRITVYRIVNGERVGFTAKELWIENYATAGRDTKVPNAMWKRRPYGQIAKCAEAQALRMAFPEAVGAEPTAEEMEGKTIDGDVIDSTARQVELPRQIEHTKSDAPAATDVQATQHRHPGANSNDGGGAPSEPFKAMIEGQKRMIRAQLARAGLTELDLEVAFPGKKLLSTDTSGFAFHEYDAVTSWIAKNAKA